MRSLTASEYDFSTPYEFAARPAWVVPANPQPGFTPADGIPNSYALIDLQIQATDDKHTCYRRLISHIADASAIEDASQFLYETVPGSEMVVFHSCEIIRGDKRIDALDKDNIRSMQRERQLESQVTTNRITIELTIDDLRVGDMIDIEVSELEIKGDHPLYGHFLRWMSRLRWSVPVATQSVRVCNNSSSALSVHQLDTENAIDTRNKVMPGATFEKQWSDVTVGQFGSRVPDNYWPSCIFVTSQSSWSEVSGYLYRYYQDSGALNESFEVDESDGLDFSTTTAESLINIIRFVQDGIRYRSESAGIFSHTPRLPSRTLKKRAGDCKDKSNLLVALLQKAGIDASLALVNTSLNDAIEDLDPSPFLFNHMIVRFNWQGKAMFVDATCQKQGGTLETLIAPDYKSALILCAQEGHLAGINKSINSLELNISHNFDFSAAEKAPAKLEIIREYHGERANNMRYYLASENTQTLQQNYHDSATDDLGVTLTVVSPFQIDEDDRQRNVVKVSERYTFDPSDEGLTSGRISVTTSFLHELSVAATEKHPVALSLNGKATHSINILYAKPPVNLDIDAFSRKNKWFSYTDSTATEGNKAIFSIALEPVSNLASAEDLDEYRKEADSVLERSSTIFQVVPEDNTGIAKTMFIFAAVLAAAVMVVNSVM